MTFFPQMNNSLSCHSDITCSVI